MAVLSFLPDHSDGIHGKDRSATAVSDLVFHHGDNSRGTPWWMSLHGVR